MLQKLDTPIAMILFRKTSKYETPISYTHQRRDGLMSRRLSDGVVIGNVKTQHNSTFTYRSWYNMIGKGVGYYTIFEMSIVISSNRAIWADFR